MTSVEAPRAATAYTPYLPRLALEWRVRFGASRAQALDGSLAGLDISGFTALSERLASRGRLGAEELILLISDTYSGLIEIATAFGGDVLKFRGDALLLFFGGDGHEERAARATLAMQAFMDDAAETSSSVGPVRLGMAAGVVSGACHVFLVGSQHRELIVAGPAASETLALEDEAGGGEILVSARTAEALDPSWLGPAQDGARLLSRDVGIGPLPDPPEPPAVHADPEELVPPTLRDSLRSGAVEAEHRQATAAFVKLAGTDALVADLDAAAASLGDLADAVSEIAAELGVTWLESDIDRDGVKLYLVAGAPSSAGGDEERMLRAARRIVDAGVGPPIAVGVNRGPVFAGAIGSPLRRTYAVMGDTVNLAARLVTRAEKGQILATGDVLQRSRARFETSARQFLVKGKERPVTGYSVGGLLESRDAEEERLPLVGRVEELAALRELLDRARGRDSAVIELVGEPGIGKSRLVEELRSLAVGFTHLDARCEEYASSIPYFPARTLLRPLAGIVADDPPEVAGARLTAWVQAAMPDLAPWLPLLAVPFDAHVAPTPETDEIDPAFRRGKLHEALEQFLTRVLLMPTLIVIEDAHWLDDATHELLAHLTQSRVPKPWAVCVTRRPESEPVAGARVLELAPLPADDARRLALAASDEPLAEDELAQLSERAGGNPLFIRELVAASRAGVELPETVETLLTARIDTLAPEDRLLLRHASVLGPSFDLGLLAEILPDELGDDDPSRWERLLDFVEWHGPSTLRFRHDLVRAAAYEGLSYQVRREIHARVGEALERRADDAEDVAGLLSLHFLEAGQHDRAWGYSVVAGDRARAVYANLDAVTFYERALRAADGLAPDPPEVARVSEALGDAYETAGRYEPADDAYLRALELLGRPDAQLLRKRGIVRERRGDYDDALALYAQGLALEGVPPGEVIELELAYATALYRQGKIEDAAAWAKRAEQHAKNADERKGLAHAYYVLAAAEGDGGAPDAAKRYLELALPVYEEIGDLVGQGIVLNNMAIFDYYAGDWTRALGRYAQGRATSLRAGDVVRAANAMNNEAEVLLDQGRAEDARALFDEALRSLRAAGFRIGAALVVVNLGRLAGLDGDFAEARRLLVEAQEEFSEIGSAAFELDAKARECECLVLEGRHREALALALETLERGSGTGELGVRTALLRRLAGYACAQARALDAARGHFDESLRVARELSAEYEAALTLKALADTGLDPAAGPQAAAILERLGVVSTPLLPLP